MYGTNLKLERNESVKTKAELRTEMLAILAKKTGINVTQDGSIVIAIVDALIEELYNLYVELEMAKQQAYLSTSSGRFTEEIAALLNIQRRPGETDDDLKIRTVNATRTHATGNRVAIESAIKAVPGVATFDFRPYGQGTGSFTVFVYPEQGFNQTRLLDAVNAALVDVVAEGIRYDVRVPREKRIDMSLALHFSEGLTVMQKQAVRSDVSSTVSNYINSLQKGSVLYINELTRYILSVDDHIKDVSYLEMKADGIQKSISNTFPESDIRFVSGTINIL